MVFQLLAVLFLLAETCCGNLSLASFSSETENRLSCPSPLLSTPFCTSAMSSSCSFDITSKSPSSESDFCTGTCVSITGSIASTVAVFFAYVFSTNNCVIVSICVSFCAIDSSLLLLISSELFDWNLWHKCLCKQRKRNKPKKCELVFNHARRDKTGIKIVLESYLWFECSAHIQQYTRWFEDNLLNPLNIVDIESDRVECTLQLIEADRSFHVHGRKCIAINVPYSLVNVSHRKRLNNSQYHCDKAEQFFLYF